MANKRVGNEIIRGSVLPGYEESYVKSAKARNIWLTEDVTTESASDMAAWLLYYDHQDPEDIITIYIHSSGGDSSGLIHVYDVMQMIRSPVRTICMGKAYSAGAVILAAGTPGERYALENSEIMIHGLQSIFPLPGLDIHNNKNYYEFLTSHNDDVMKILANHTKKTLKQIKIDCVDDNYLTAKDAKKYGIIDSII